MKITTLGIDLAKTVFHLVGLDEKGHEVMKKKVSRKDLAATIQNIQPCRIAMEACGSASFWGRKFETMGHTVILIPPQYVKPFVRAIKNDADDGLATCEASLQPTTPERSGSIFVSDAGHGRTALQTTVWMRAIHFLTCQIFLLLLRIYEKYGRFCPSDRRPCPMHNRFSWV